MRILFLTQVLPYPLDAGPKVRAHFVIRYLAEAGHRVRLLSFVRSGESNEHLESLRRLCESVETVPIVRSRLRDLRDGLRSVWTNQPFLVLRDQVAAMEQAVRRIAPGGAFDAVHADQLWMAHYGMLGEVPAGFRVLDQHNAVFMVPQRLADHQRNRLAGALLRHEAAKLETFERHACARFDRVVWVTEEDRRAVLQGADNRSSRDIVIPIAADPDGQRQIARVRPFRVTFLGGLHWPPNREGVSWFLKHVWQRVARAVPSAVLTIIGKGGEALQPVAEGQSRVDITGYIRDPHALLAETAVFVVPLRSGAGMRVKIVEAWCWGLPIVSTTVGAEGLKAIDGENIAIADDQTGFAEAVIALMRQPRAAQRLAANGRATAETHYDWKTLYTAWDEVYQRPSSELGSRNRARRLEREAAATPNQVFVPVA